MKRPGLIKRFMAVSIAAGALSTASCAGSPGHKVTPTFRHAERVGPVVRNGKAEMTCFNPQEEGADPKMQGTGTTYAGRPAVVGLSAAADLIVLYGSEKEAVRRVKAGQALVLRVYFKNKDGSPMLDAQGNRAYNDFEIEDKGSAFKGDRFSHFDLNFTNAYVQSHFFNSNGIKMCKSFKQRLDFEILDPRFQFLLDIQAQTTSTTTTMAPPTPPAAVMSIG